MTLQNSGLVTVYTNEVPYDTDILRSNLYNLTGVSALAATTVGCGINYGTTVRGFPCIPVSPPGLSVVVGSTQTPDIIYSLQPLNATNYGSIPADTTPSDRQFKQGFNWGQVTLSTPAPVTTGYSVIHLVEVGFSTQDVNNVSRPYYNSANPAVPIFNNNYDTRVNLAIIQLKQGVAALSPTPPTPDPGFIGLWYITVTYGQTSIVSGNIAKVSTVEGSPFITESLTNKISQATANGLYASISALQTPFNVYAANDTGSTNSVVANASPAYTARAGSRVYINVGHSNTGAATLTLNAISAAPINVITPSGYSALSGGEMTSPGVYEFYGINSPAVWQLMNPNIASITTPQVVTSWNGSTSPVAVTSGTNISLTGGAVSFVNGSAGAAFPTVAQIQQNSFTLAYDVGTVNSVILNPSPAYVLPSSQASFLWFTATHTNTGPATVTINGYGPGNIEIAPAIPLRGGEILSGGTYGLLVQSLAPGNAAILVSGAPDAAQQGGYYVTGQDIGAVNAYVAIPYTGNTVDLFPGSTCTVYMANTNTSTVCTLNWGNTGALPIRAPQDLGGVPRPGALLIGYPSIFVIDPTLSFWVLINPYA